MRSVKVLLSLAAAASVLGGCTLAPTYRRPELPVPAALPTGAPYAAQTQAPPNTVGYTDVIVDQRLRGLVERALANNRDLRVAAGNIVVAREQYRIQRGALLPTVNLSGNASSRVGSTGTGAGIITGGGSSSRSYTVNIGVNAFELDLFGRVRSLSAAALQRYLATEEGAQALRITLIGDVADAWSTYAADVTLLRIAEQTAANARRSVDLTQARLAGAVAPRTDLAQAQGVLADAEASIAEQKTAVAQDLNALQLLVGAPIDAALLPASIDDTTGAFAVLPAGTDSSVLLRRPDIMQAEHTLRAANANIGAARAALFPRLSLTALTGVAGGTIDSLTGDGAGSKSGTLALGLPIFQGGAGIAALGVSRAQREIAIANYERAIQAAFRDTADALARQGTIGEQLAAQQRALAAAADTDRLTEARYRSGIDAFLTSLVAQRQLFAARRTMTQVQLTSAINRVALYRALGGGGEIPQVN